MELLDEQPKGKQDYDSWISNGVILSKGIKMTEQDCLRHFVK